MIFRTLRLLAWICPAAISFNSTATIFGQEASRQIARLQEVQEYPCISQKAYVWWIRGTQKVAVCLDCERRSGWERLYYKTSDLGKTWNRVEGSTVEGDPMQLGPHPVDPRVMYRIGGQVGVRLFLERSQDGGITWDKIRARVFETSEVLESYGFRAYHPTDPSTIYITAGLLGTKRQAPRSGPNGLFVSRDGGDTFSLLVGDIYPAEFAISESRPETMYVGTFGRYLLKSDNGGSMWQFVGPCTQNAMNCGAESGAAKNELDSLRWIHHIVIHPRDHRIVYATASDGIWKTEDGAAHWCLIKLAPNVKSVGELVIAVNETEETILAGTDAGLFVSRDSGKTWAKLDLSLIR